MKHSRLWLNMNSCEIINNVFSNTANDQDFNAATGYPAERERRE